VALGERLGVAPPPTERQLLAEALGVDEDAFRDWLRSAIQARLREKGESWHELDVALE
jgi:lambda repressor-like predicted transcriptional regulator